MKIATCLSICLWSLAASPLFSSFAATPEKPTVSYPARLIGDTIEFSGYEWLVKDSKGRLVGPGKNYFLSSPENVWVDEAGRLHLRLTYREEKWYCPEVHLLKSLGSGTYEFRLAGITSELDKDLVVGIFLYDYDNTDKHHNEIDIEFSKWGEELNRNSQYVIQPHVEKAFRYDTDLTKPTVHSIHVEKKSVVFSSKYISGNKKDMIANSKLRLRKGYEPVSDHVCINVWLYKATEPTNLKEFEVVVTGFGFTPAD